MLIKAKVTTDASRDKVTCISGDAYHVSVRAPAKDNLANKRVCEIFARFLGVSRKDVKIIRGHHKPSKIISIEGR